jgi:glycosyltransferase involved in cell wall biosynthesis
MKSFSRRIGVIIPTYNHAAFLPSLLKRALALPWPVMVVDDGSTDETPQYLKTVKNIILVCWPRNRGKGVALAAGMAKAGELGFDTVITLDADGQHDPADAPRLLEALAAGTGSLVIGSREYGQEGAPARSRFGRAFSNFWIWMETGLKVRDAQSGFRVYPVALVNALHPRSHRYGWETEVLVRLAWGGVQVKEVPISISYVAKPASHFRPFTDFFLNSCVNAFLVCRRIWPWPIKRLVPETKIDWPSSWKERLRLAWDRYVWNPEQNNLEIAAAIGFGVFMGIFPIWGFQMLVAAYLAQRLHMNTLLVLLASNISLPPVIPFIVYSATVLGHFILNGKWDWILNWQGFNLEMAKARTWEFFIGSAVLALIMGSACGIAGYIALSVFKPKMKRTSS